MGMLDFCSSLRKNLLPQRHREAFFFLCLCDSVVKAQKLEARSQQPVMKISPQWLRDFVDLDVNYHQLADDLTLAGIAVESVSGEGDATIFEMDITTNRPDAMNHYGTARECSAIYDLPLRAIDPALPTASLKSQTCVLDLTAEPFEPRFRESSQY